MAEASLRSHSTPARLGAIHLAMVTLAAALVVIAVQDVPYLLSWPLWGDEAWVVISRKFPITDLPSLISSTPIGWNFLVQQFAFLGDAGGRMLVQLFNVGSIVVAYYLGREIPARRSKLGVVLSGIFVAVSVAVTPATLTRLDIKHYTSDAFFLLLLLLLVVQQVRAPERGRIVMITVISSLVLSLSLSAVFVVPSVFAALVVQQLVTRAWPDLRRTLIGGGIALVSMIAWYLAFYSHGDNEALRSFWNAAYPRSILAVPGFIGSTLLQIDVETTYRYALLIVPVVVIGTILLAGRGWWGPAAFGPGMLVLMIILGVLKRYPLLDSRTSHFFLVFTSVLCAVSTILIAEWLAARLPRPRQLATIIIAGVTALLLVLALPLYRSHTLPQYDTGNQAAYVESHIAPGDLVLYNQLASYQLGMSWARDKPSWCANPEAWTGFDICYPGVNDLKPFYSLKEAYRLIDEHLSEHPGTRVWLIRSHVFIEYEQMEGELPTMYDYRLIGLPIQPVGVIYGFRR